MGVQKMLGGGWVRRERSRAWWTTVSGPGAFARWLLLLLLLLFPACDPGSQGPQRGEASLDEGTVHFLDTAPPPAERIPGPPAEIFGFETNPIESVRALAWTRDGQILLADAGRALLLLSADGDSLRTLGGSGDGPGEFRQILMAGATETGGVVYFDPALNRMTELSPSFEVARLWSPEPPPGSGSLFAPIALTADGALLGFALPMLGHASESVRSSPRRDDSGLWRYAPVLRVAESGVDTVTEMAVVRCLPNAEVEVSTFEGNEGIRPECSPDGDMAVMTSGEHGTVLAPRDWAEARIFGADGEPRYSIRVDDPEAEPFSKVLWDDRGRLWLGHWRSPEWWVVQEGETARIELPGGFELWDVSHDRALGVVRGPLGTQRIGVLALPAMD